MEDKKVKSGSVAIGICLFVIAVLLILIVLFFYNAKMEKNNLEVKVDELETIIKEKDEKVNELEDKVSKVSDVINDVANKSEVKLGDFIANKTIDPSVGEGIDKIILKENDEFDLDLVYGGTTYSGKFEIVGEKLICTATRVEGYEGGEYKRKTNDVFQFEIINENELKFENCDTVEIISKDVKYINIEEKVLTEEEAKKLIKEKYELAIDLFLDVGKFECISDINDSRVIEEKVEGQNYTWHYYPITNYDEIVNEYLSDNIKSYFEEKNSRIITKNEKKYTTDGGVGFISYDEINEIKNLNITSEKITCTVKIKCVDIDDKFKEYRESDFSIIKEGDTWLIEKFDYDKII